MTNLTLAIETSNPSTEAGVVIGSAAGLLGIESVNAGDGRHDDLMSAIDRLCRRTGVKPRDLKRVAVSIGPGGYTTLRIAVATTKMLCETLKAECIAVETAKVVAHRVLAEGPFLVLLASKDGSAFGTIFENPHRQRQPGHLMSTLEGLEVRTVVADRFLPASIATEVAARGISIVTPRFDPAACLELSFGATPIDPVSLAAQYPREPEAVTKWRRLHGG